MENKKSRDDLLMKLAERLAQRVSPIDSNLEREVIDIYDCLVEAWEFGYARGWDDSFWEAMKEGRGIPVPRQ